MLCMHVRPLKSQLEQWHQRRVPIGWWGPRIALTASVAYQRGMDHCVGLMAAPEVP